MLNLVGEVFLAQFNISVAGFLFEQIVLDLSNSVQGLFLIEFFNFVEVIFELRLKRCLNDGESIAVSARVDLCPR
jgi:hypothetical protein